MLTSTSPWLGTRLHAANPIPTLSYTNGQQKVGAPDWSKITWSSLPPIQSPGWIQVPPNLGSELGYNPSRTWQAGQTPDTLMMLGDVADAFGLQEFSLANVAQITGGAANVGRLKDLKLTSWQTIGSLVEAIPGLENLPISQVKPIYDLVSRFSSGNSQLGPTIGLTLDLNPALASIPLGEIDLAQYPLDSIPGLVFTPLKKFQAWQQSLISQIPGLNLVPFSLFPITPGMGVGAVAQADVVWGSAERGDPTVGAERFVSGSATDGGTVPVNCEAEKHCAYLELSDPAGAIGPRHGQRWASGETQKVKGGRGVLAAVNNGWEPTGRLVYGDAFKVVLTKTHESTGTAEFGLYLRVCIKNTWVDLGCTPYFIGPIPWIPVREKDLVILAASDRPQINPPKQYQEQIDQILAQYQPQTNPGEIAQPGTPPPPGQLNQAIINSVNRMGNFPSGAGHSPSATLNGSLACMWAVNQILKNAGLRPLGNDTLAVLVARTELQRGRGVRVPLSEARPGDLTIVNAGGSRQHIGICLNNGCTRVKSNSSSRASFSWISGPGFKYPGSPYNGGTTEIWRVKN